MDKISNYMDYITIFKKKTIKVTRKREGFKDQLAIILPENIQKECQFNSFTKPLYVTDIGYYPNARYHFRERLEGSKQHIVVYCLEGEGWLELGNIRHRIEKDQYFILPANLPHRYGASQTTPWSIRWLHFTGENSVFFSGDEGVISTIKPTENSRYQDRMQLFQEMYQTLSMGYSKENLEYSTVCLWHFLGSLKYAIPYQRIRAIQEHDVVEKSIHFMQDHCHQSLQLEELASYCGFSVSHFSMVFKKKTTRSPMEYFLALKMQKACQMLDFTSMRIHEIAAELAFQDQFYFSRMFRKVIGLSPREYRKKKKG